VARAGVAPDAARIGMAFPGTFVLDRHGRVVSRSFEDLYVERATVSSVLMKLGDRGRDDRAGAARAGAADEVPGIRDLLLQAARGARSGLCETVYASAGSGRRGDRTGAGGAARKAVADADGRARLSGMRRPGVLQPGVRS